MFHIPMSSPQRIRMFGFFVAIVALALQICVETPRVNGVGCEGRGSPRRGASGRPVQERGETIADRSKRAVNQTMRCVAFERNANRITRYGQRVTTGGERGMEPWW